MNDRELLEKAAKAAGYLVNHVAQKNQDRFLGLFKGLWIDGVSTCWNTIDNNEDAFLLLSRLKIQLSYGNLWVEANILEVGRGGVIARSMVNYMRETDSNMATRLAITRAAASLCND